MRRRRIWIMVVGFLVALGCLSLQWDHAQAEDSDSLRCSLDTLQGTYIFAYEGFTIENDKQLPFSYAGQEVYYGDGTMTGISARISCNEL